MAYKRSKFPSEYDVLPELVDLSPSMVTKANRYKILKLKENKNTDEINELNLLTNELQNYIISPEVFNTLGDAITGTQKFFVENVNDYITNMQTDVSNYVESKKTEFQAGLDKFAYKNEYSPSITYYKNNVVKYQGNGYICLQDNTIGISPTDNTKWGILVEKGERGETGYGVGVSPKGDFFTSTQYYVDDVVLYKGNLFRCIQDSINHYPTDTNYWELFLSGYGENLDDLQTTNKNGLVNAINEVHTKSTENANQIVLLNQEVDEISTRIDTEMTNTTNSLRDQNMKLQKELAYIKLKQEASDRIEGGNLFANDMNGSSFGMTFKNVRTKSTEPLNIGETILNGKIGTIENGQFEVGDKVVVLDDINSETVEVTRVDTINEQFYLECSPLQNVYKKGAWVAQSTMNQDGTFPQWDGNFTTNTVTDTTVVNSAYDTSGNGGRKLARLSNGWLVAVVLEKHSTLARVRWYVAKGMDINQQLVWESLTRWEYTTTNVVDVSMVSNGTNVYTIVSIDNGSASNRYVFAYHFDAITVPEVISPSGYQTNIDTGQSAIGNISLTINPQGTELHATWISKNSTYPNSWNVRYAKGTINADGSVTWGSVEQVGKQNASTINLKDTIIFIDNLGNPCITCSYINGTTVSDLILFTKSFTSQDYSGSQWSVDWGNKKIYSGGSYTQSSTSTIFVPNSVNGLSNGLLANVWQGYDSTHTSTYYIRFSKSTDGGVTWSAMQKLVAGINPTLSANKNGKLFITYEDSGVIKRIESSNNGDTWTSPITISDGTNPSSLLDLSMDSISPLTIHKGTSSVLFNGEWIIGQLSPLTNSIGNYELPSTDYVGAFVQKQGNITDVKAYINNELMDSELENNEYMFTKQLTTASPITLRIEANRENTANSGDKISRILGGFN